MRFFLACLTSLAFALGCAGTSPRTTAQLSPNRGAVILAARINTPNGRAYAGGVTLTLQGIGGGSLESYRIFLPARKTLLYQIAPGRYRLEPPLGIFGFPKKTLSINADGEKYAPTFPKPLSDLPVIKVKPEQTVAIGELDISVSHSSESSPRAVSIQFHPDAAAQRRVIEEIIRDMPNPDLSEEEQTGYQSWIGSLQKALTEASAMERSPAPKP